MEIKNCLNAVNAYKTIGFESKGKNRTTAKASANTDVVEFSSLKDNVENMKHTIAKSVDSQVSPERINALKNAVADGSYNVSAESIAMSILG